MNKKQDIAEEEEYIVYTADGEPLRIIKKEEAKHLPDHEWLQGVTCFVINQEGKVLVETRENTQEDAGMFDLCSGHVNYGEMTTHAVVRELREELSIPFEIACNVKKIMDLTSVTKGNQHFFVTVYALFLGDYNIQYEAEEIADITYKSREETYALLRQNQLRIQYNEKWEEVFTKIENICAEKGIKKS